jgi:Disulphide bond corrector protein DsbC
MRISAIFLISLLSLLLLLAGCTPTTKPGSESFGLQPSVAEEKRIASADVVKINVQPVEIPAGSSGEATLRLTIQSGYHVNANPPTYPYLIATSLEIVSAEGISAGPVKYPAALTRQFPFAEKPLAVYEGETELKTTIGADKSATPGSRSLSAKLRVQACDDQVCYPPGTVNLSIPVTVK